MTSTGSKFDILYKNTINDQPCKTFVDSTYIGNGVDNIMTKK